MKLSIITSVRSVALVSFVSFVSAPVVAFADDRVDAAPITCVTGQFAQHVEGGKPAGDNGAIFGARKATYWVDLANTGDASQVTLVWSLDGKEVQRQTLDVGQGPHWHTWGTRPLGGAHKVDVEVLDAAGHSLRTDTLSAPAPDAG